MSEAISTTRLAEIRENDRLDRQRGSVTASMVADIADHRTELLAEVDRLTRQAAIKDEAIESLRRTPNHNLERADRLKADRDQARARVAALEATSDMKADTDRSSHLERQLEGAIVQNGRHQQREAELRARVAELETELADTTTKLTAALRVVAEANSLTDRIERADQTIANSAEIITARDTRIRELEGKWNAIRSWTRSRLQNLDSAQRDWRQSSENAAKQAVLGDLSRCLEHLTEPQPAAAPDRSDGSAQ